MGSHNIYLQKNTSLYVSRRLPYIKKIHIWVCIEVKSYWYLWLLNIISITLIWGICVPVLHFIYLLETVKLKTISDRPSEEHDRNFKSFIYFLNTNSMIMKMFISRDEQNKIKAEGISEGATSFKFIVRFSRTVY